MGSGLASTGGANFLGLSAAAVQDRQIQHGDEIDFLFPPGQVRALAMTLTSGDPLLAGDIQLVTDQGVVVNVATPLSEADDGGQVYFLGLIAEWPIEQVLLRYGDEDNQVAFLYTIDRIELGLLPEIFRDRFQPVAEAFNSAY